MFFFVSTVTCAMMVLVSAYPSGAPLEACKSFETEHDDPNTNTRIKPQISVPPYEIFLNPSNIFSGGQAEITIQGVGGEFFKGYLIQAIDKVTGDIVGHFSGSSGGLSQTLDCPGGPSANTATHTEKFAKSQPAKTSVKLIYKAPVGYKGDLVFRATVVKTHAVFWYGLRSSPLTVA